MGKSKATLALCSCGWLQTFRQHLDAPLPYAGAADRNADVSNGRLRTGLFFSFERKTFFLRALFLLCSLPVNKRGMGKKHKHEIDEPPSAVTTAKRAARCSIPISLEEQDPLPLFSMIHAQKSPKRTYQPAPRHTHTYNIPVCLCSGS